MMDDAKVEKHIDVLDGVRAIAVGFVAWFHFWQQSWLTPSVTFPTGIARYFGITGFNLEGFVRYGFVFVDMLILLSAFCNFYPYARAILLGEPWPDTKAFYLKRAARILPSYYLSLMVMIIVMLIEGNFVINSFFWKDLFTHVICISPLFPDTYIGTHFNGVLWTVQIEVLYYLVMPWIAKLFRKWPVVTCFGLWGCGIVSANYIAYEKADMIRIYGNHIASFAGCYANGMLLCVLYVTMCTGRTWYLCPFGRFMPEILDYRVREAVPVIWSYCTMKGRSVENKYTRLAATVAALCCILYLSRMMKQLGSGELQVVQLQQRFELSLVFSCFLLALPFAYRGVKFIFANKMMKFLAGISYNFYIWHQYIAVKCKEYHIPYWEGDTPPNMLGDKAWMWKYQILIVVLSLAAAVVLTYCFEKPAARLILKKKGHL